VNDAQLSKIVLSRLFGAELGAEAGARLWEGSTVRAPRARFELIVRTPFALRAAFLPPPELNPGRAFVEGWIDVEGDLEAAIDALERSVARLSRLDALRLASLLLRMSKPPKIARRLRSGRVHSKARDAAAIGFHYDLPLAFYQAFLDRDLVYSCAYWDAGIENLDDAQRAKLDYVLDKLRLQPGMRFLDIGCGWGSLVIRAAQRGACAIGITLSRPQCEEAMRRIEAAGLQDSARVEQLDYRSLREREFDAIASVGMVEHVGRERLHEYFGAAYRALRPGGLFLNHGIAAQSRDGNGVRIGGRDFIGRYVFPDGDLVSIAAIVRQAESVGFEVRDVENLREHYARTLRTWVANLTANRRAALAATDERTERVWRLYMTGSARGFALGRMGLAQTLFAKPHVDGQSRIPATRRDLYRNQPLRKER
jgi:cyclopropane-fatty-acyl-phospholipid synthase